MFDDDLTVVSRLSGGAGVSGDAALFLSRKVAAAQRELVNQMRTEAAERARPETSRREPEATLENGRTDQDIAHDIEPVVEIGIQKPDDLRQLDISV